jgi:hypothetical protein
MNWDIGVVRTKKINKKDRDKGGNKHNGHLKTLKTEEKNNFYMQVEVTYKMRDLPDWQMVFIYRFIDYGAFV